MKFTQVCVWPGTVCGESKIEDFQEFMLEEFGTRVKYLEEVLTNPDIDKNGRVVSGTGGRNDLIFSVCSEDIPKFAVKRLAYGIRWIEDALSNGAEIYPERLAEYKTW